MIEVAVHVADRGAHKKGDPVAVRTVGMFVSGEQMLEWIEVNLEPFGFATLDAELVTTWRSLIEECRTIGDNDTALSIPAAMIRYPNATQAELGQIIAHVRERRGLYIRDGFDLCWGEDDRKDYGIVTMADATSDEVLDRDAQGVPKNRIDYRGALDAKDADDLEKTDAPKRALRSRVLPKTALKTRV